MGQLNFHNVQKSTPPKGPGDFTTVHQLTEAYILWHRVLPQLSRPTQHTLGAAIDTAFTELIELAIRARFAKTHEQQNFLKQMSDRLDMLKQFMTILWEMKAVHQTPYAQLAEKLVSIGKMIGGWLKKLT